MPIRNLVLAFAEPEQVGNIVDAVGFKARIEREISRDEFQRAVGESARQPINRVGVYDTATREYKPSQTLSAEFRFFYRAVPVEDR